MITKEERTIETLQETVRTVYKVLRKTEKYMAIQYDYIHEILPKEIFFITTQELEDMFPGLTEEYALTAAEMDDKAILGNYAQEWGGAEEGVDYAESEILVEAETEEEANAYAQAFNGTLTGYFLGVAVITLNADESLPEAA